MDINEQTREEIRTPLLIQGPNVIGGGGGGGGMKRARGEESSAVEGEPQKKKAKTRRRAAVTARCAVSRDELAWNLRVFRYCPFTGIAVTQLSTITLTGGARITIGDLVDLRDFTASTEAYMMEQLEHALHWIMIAGFIPFCLEPNSDVLDERVDGNREVLFDVLEPQMVGSFERYFNPITRRVEVRFIKDWKTYEDDEEEGGQEDDEDPASHWYVYCVTAPDEKGSIVSSISHIRPEFKALELVYKPADVDGTLLATHPIPVDEELPNRGRGSLVDVDEAGRRQLEAAASGTLMSGGGVAGPPGFPRLPLGAPRFPESQFATHEYVPNRVDAERILRQGTGVTDSGAYHIAPGRSHSGVLVPHAFTSVSQRVTDYIRYVSSALRVPYHLIDPLRNVSSKTGSSASGRHKSSISRAAPLSGGGGGSASHANSSGGSNYTADPIFVPALQYRRILADFVKTVLGLKHGREAGSVIGRLKTAASEELQMQNQIIDELEDKIKKARAAIITYDPSSNSTATAAETEEKKKGEGSEAPSPSKPEQLPSLVAPEVEELTRRRESIQTNVQLLSDAVQKLSSIKDQRSPFRLKWHQPFMTDTANLTAVAQQLNLPPEEASGMFRQRLGLF